MRVELTAAEMRGDENAPEPQRGRGNRFRVAIRQCRGTADAKVLSPELPLRDRTGQPAVNEQPLQRSQGSAPSRGIERVEHTESATPAAHRVDCLRAVITTTSHGVVDFSVRNGADGVLIAIAAAPVMAARMSTATGTLGRSLSVREVRARSIRVTASAPGTPSRDGGKRR